MGSMRKDQPGLFAGQSPTEVTDFRVRMSDNRVMLIKLDSTVLDTLLKHATSAARHVGHIDDSKVGPLADDIDAIVHELSELLGRPHLIPAPVSRSLSMASDAATRDDWVAHDDVPEHVVPVDIDAGMTATAEEAGAALAKPVRYASANAEKER